MSGFGGSSRASQVFHLWANASKPEGRRGDGRVFFRGPAFYSFGTHYVAAYLMPDETAKAGTGQAHVALFNASKYSPTTSGHVSACRSAASHLTGHLIPGLTEFVAELGRANNGYVYDGNTTRNPTEAEKRGRIRELTEGHVRKHWREFKPGEAVYYAPSVDAAAYLLSLGGHRNPAAMFARIVKEETAKAVRANAKAAKAARAYMIREAKTEADGSEAEFRESVRRSFERTYGNSRRIDGKWDSETGRRKPDRYVFEVSGELVTRAAHYWNLFRLGKAAIGVRRVAILKARHAALKLAVADFEGKRKAVDRNKGRRTAIRHTRDGIAMLAKGAEGAAKFTSSVYRMFGEALRKSAAMIGDNRHLLKLAMAADEMAVVRNREEREAARIEHERREAEYKRQRELREAREAATRAAWFAGDSSVSWHGSDENGNAFIRAIRVARDVATGAIVAGELQTSHGADVPLTHAIRAFRFLKLCHDTGRTWNANGRTIRVGHFRIDRVRPDGFKAGCHRISWQECERVAVALGVFDGPADESALEPSHVAA